MEDTSLITYAHIGDPTGIRYRQYAKDPVPPWAVDIKPDVTPSEEEEHDDS